MAQSLKPPPAAMELEIEGIDPVPTLYAPAYQQIREMILDGRLLPGARIEEEVFCKAFGISRTPLREALHRLDHDGLATIWPRRGAFVTDMSKTEVLELLELREALEGFAARLASERADASVIARLKGLVDPARLRDLSEHNPKRLADTDRAFHELVYEATRNSKLIETSRRINDQVHVVRLTTTLLSDRRTKSAKEISQIVRAIENRKGDEAERLARDHVRHAIDAVQSTFPDGAMLSAIARRIKTTEGSQTR